MPPRAARIYVDEAHGIPLLQGSQMPLMRPYGLKYISKIYSSSIDRWIIHTNWVLVTRSGTIGRVGLCSEGQNGWAASEHMIRIKATASLDPGFLVTFLATAYGQHQMKAKIYGGVVDELTEDDLAEVLIPHLGLDKQLLVGAAMCGTYRLRDEANELEQRAIKEFEAGIGGH